MKKLTERQMFKLLMEAIDEDIEKEQKEYADEDELSVDGPVTPQSRKNIWFLIENSLVRLRKLMGPSHEVDRGRGYSYAKLDIIDLIVFLCEANRHLQLNKAPLAKLIFRILLDNFNERHISLTAKEYHIIICTDMDLLHEDVEHLYNMCGSQNNFFVINEIDNLLLGHLGYSELDTYDVSLRANAKRENGARINVEEIVNMYEAVRKRTISPEKLKREYKQKTNIKKLVTANYLRDKDKKVSKPNLFDEWS